ncbi:sialic acid-binding Ig-like lectin 10 [Danio aesculapii]|uniref:sialic acid-binding Ig-like lectin 10 n=1 Tax=Danio aesculapii TaxID=1142201 RepID=UPI0024BFAC24|nr:sialic acid-binding Ig-like lectin 10 [Danio aesculapii]
MDTAEKIIIFCFLLRGVCCRDFNISLPEKIQALSGSCVIIKCRFDIKEEYDKDLTERAAGVWFINETDVGKNLIFNSSASVQNSFIKGNITGKLIDKDCTTVFYDVRSKHSGQYFFRIEGEGGLKWNYKESNVSLEVIESPVNPQVVLYVDEQELQDQQEVLEGRSVCLHCSAETLCSSPPATLTWSSTARIPLSESSKLQERIISDLNFTAAQRHHRVTFTCSINYQLQDYNRTAHSSITLHVQYAPQISISSSCTSTDVTLCFCEVDGNPSPEVEWHLTGRLVSNSSNTFISEEQLSNTSLRSFISLHQSLTHTNPLLCVSKNSHGNASQQLLLPPATACNACLSYSFMLIGVPVLALVILVSVIICIRKERGKQQQTKQEECNNGSSQNAIKENEGDSLYVTMSSVGTTKGNLDVKSVSSLHDDYVVIYRGSGGPAKAKSSVRESSNSTEAQVIERADELTKQTESKQLEEELFEEDSQLYAKIKHCST